MKSVSVGICAFNEERRIGPLLDSLLLQAIRPWFELDEILVVASGSTDRTEQVVLDYVFMDSRVVLVSEAKRDGKASALNRILRTYSGEILVLVNADARVPDESLRSLLAPFEKDETVMVACGLPEPIGGDGRMVRSVVGLAWRIHNRTLVDFSRAGLDVHCCDEFLAFRRGFLETIPSEVVNDGAYIASWAASHGCRIRVCPTAVVEIESPRTLKSFLLQRRRILRGHDQIRDMTGKPSNTLESSLRVHPGLVARVLSSEFRDRLGSLVSFVFLALPLELMAHLLSRLDRLRGRPYPIVWPTVD